MPMTKVIAFFVTNENDVLGLRPLLADRDWLTLICCNHEYTVLDHRFPYMLLQRTKEVQAFYICLHRGTGEDFYSLWILCVRRMVIGLASF